MIARHVSRNPHPSRRAAHRIVTGRIVMATVAAALVLAACGGTDSDSPAAEESPAADADDGAPAVDGAPTTTGPADRATPETVPQVASSPVDVTLSGLDALRSGLPDGAPEPLVPLEEIRSGGPPPDGIPPIDTPRFVSASAVDFLEENEPVVVIDVDGESRAYPIQILMWHEIVNDTIAGVPVTVSYCPLCNSAVAYDRRLDDRILDFGTSGSLWNSALVMYDRQTETLWSHFTAEGLVGELTGERLDTLPVATVAWGVWRDANPDALVLSTETGFNRNYGRNPYPGYDDIDSSPFLFSGEVDGTFAAMTRIVGIELDADALAIPLFRLQEERVVEAAVGGIDVVAFWAPGTASALDAGSVAGGDDIGATGVFVPEVDGEPLTFSPLSGVDDEFVDDQTGSTWSILGRAVDGPMEGSRLDRVEHLDTFWFAWAAFQPDSALIE